MNGSLTHTLRKGSLIILIVILIAGVIHNTLLSEVATWDNRDLSVLPGSQITTPKGLVTYEIHIGGTTDPIEGEYVTLSATTTHPGITYTIAPNNRAAPFTSTMTVDVSASTPPGTYSITVVATSTWEQAHTRSDTVQLIVMALMTATVIPPSQDELGEKQGSEEPPSQDELGEKQGSEEPPSPFGEPEEPQDEAPPEENLSEEELLFRSLQEQLRDREIDQEVIEELRDTLDELKDLQQEAEQRHAEEKKKAEQEAAALQMVLAVIGFVVGLVAGVIGSFLKGRVRGPSKQSQQDGHCPNCGAPLKP